MADPLEYDEDTVAGLISAIKAEDDLTSGHYRSELQAGLAEDLQRYYGWPYGDEQPHRSQIVDKTVHELVEWIRPDIVRMMTAGGRICEAEDPSKGVDDDASDLIAEVLNYVVFEDNDGLRFIDSWAFDGLVQKNGIAAAYWEPEQWSEETVYEGLNSLQVQYLQDHPRTEVLEVSAEPRPGDPSFPDGQAYTATVLELVHEGRVRLDNVPPENFRITNRAASLETARHVGRMHRLTRTQLLTMWPHKRDVIQQLSPNTRNVDTDQLRYTRFSEESDFYDQENHVTPETDEFEVWEDYIRYDLNGDELAEMVQVWHVEERALDITPVDEHPFETFTPVPIPHKFWGLSMVDVCGDLQRAKTVVQRAMLDSTYMAVSPRVVVDEDNVDLDDLLTVRPGGVIRVRGGVMDKVQPLVQAPVISEALAAMDKLDQAVETRTGINRHGQGLDPSAINKTATGIELLQGAASIRKEMIGRYFASSMERLLSKVLRLLVRHQTHARMLRLYGRPVMFEPHQWGVDTRVRVESGLGTMSPEKRGAFYQNIMGMQTQFAERYGLNTPIVTIHHMHNAVEGWCRAYGLSSADAFFGRPPPDYQLEPPPDPKAEAEKAKLEAEQAQFEAQLALDKARAQTEGALKHMELQSRHQLKVMELQQDDVHHDERMVLDYERSGAELTQKSILGFAELQVKGDADNVRIGGNLNA